MRPGLKISLAVHALVIILLFFGLPVFNRDHKYEAQIVTVEVLPISEITNVKPKQAKPKAQEKKELITKTTPKISKPEPQPKPEPEPVKEPLPTPKPVEKKEEPKKESIKIKPVEKPKPKEEEKKPEPKQEPKKEKPKASEDDFAAVIKSVEEGRKKSDEKAKDEKTDQDFDKAVDFLSNAKDSDYKEGVPLSMNEKDAIRQQIMKNWSVPAGAKDIQNTVVTLHINLQPDGTVTKVEIKNARGDAFYRAMAESAMRAVYKSSPLKNLPPEKYDVRDGWRELEINFDPKEMVY